MEVDMRKIYDKSRILNAMSESCHKDLLESLTLDLFLIEYEAGELIAAPWLDNFFFQLVLSGELSIYFIRDDGSTYSLADGRKNYVLGEMDLFHIKNSNIYAEATERLTTIAFITKDHEEELYQNSRFMYFVGKMMAQKTETLCASEAASSTLRERVLSYMKYKCENKQLKGIEKTAFRLHCSSRQLQRILNDYEKNGLVVKIEKGTYRLADTSQGSIF